jgi:hypothetical protein
MMWMPKREPPDPWKVSAPDGFAPDTGGFSGTGAFSCAEGGAAAGRAGVGLDSGRQGPPKGLE